MEWDPNNICWYTPLYRFDDIQPSPSITAQNEVPGIGMLFSEDGDRPAPNTNYLAWDPSVQLPSHVLPTIQPAQQQSNPDRQLRCEWKDCRYSGTFRRKAELLRHVDTIHVNPQSFKCQRCASTFNRKYNLKDHSRRVHKTECL
ncbi:hypothetical protein P168DRAFT_293591 [Aspergillus campestris IBT 28561]|uniref:C2H2-type domain-containing protein n=1 Tax=Aspergillus campestris (strain IBT 28561) TaxID=1392248 RepID=A0A2I1CRS0_ASPC2|nr:uncharacterized protein P168DRAFT_293591 [Aspergillus campestris IBT 28561]PKY00309.1 hypothetical protein P168DRAFT_293591 [Aspergillus campestris IBT 28561]